MAKTQKALKCRNYMYEQQLSYLPNNMTPEQIYTHIEQTTHPKRIASIVHNKDLKDDNKTPAEEHIHIMLQYDNARSLKQLAKDIGDNPQQLTIWGDRPENGFSYLVHATNNARSKHQYSCDEVTANFDFPALISRVTQKVNKVAAVSTANKMNGILDLVATGDMSLEDAKYQLSGSEYAKVADKLTKAHALYLEKMAIALQREMTENDERVSVHWFYGPTETGKSYLAEKLALETGLPYYKTTTSKDPFQFYQAQPVIILDELRPDMIPYSELLALLNPFSRGNVAVSSRYFNKALSCKIVFITTPYCPVTFYRGYRLNNIDTGEQLYRRLSSVLMFDMDWVHKMEFKAEYNRYMATEHKENNYSRKKQKEYLLCNIFDRLD